MVTHVHFNLKLKLAVHFSTLALELFNTNKGVLGHKITYHSNTISQSSLLYFLPSSRVLCYVL